ncbi:Cof-type HAD-IIB family hydrolase [Salisediminibacterium beveridgei]|uniref:Hydrolase (HAD superfamily) n=1 Tax=Salisediminibacterium beveridgei TaxID=632773 RepID=A0A1D7QVI1_9BACI|nr:Cof-type HAD-IIB family hydrolase [Salisediminibacterium beveridgei]AOM83021.1 Hydrolase (HAD superfamily) [Salisediminibacterium beveridgei]
MTNDIQLVALDIDGTLIKEDMTIHPEHHEAIQKLTQNGIAVVLSTGRSLPSCKRYAEELNLKDLIITGNGSEVWRLPDRVLHRVPLNPDRVETMWALRKKYDTFHWAATTEAMWKSEMPDRIHNHTWLKFGFDTKDDFAREAIVKTLSEFDDLEITNSSLTNIEVNAKGVNKANALKIVSEKLGIPLSNMMAMGDSLNDVSMIEACGTGVAMGNAQEVTKKAADYITLTNEEAGIAHALRHFKLI